jgi:hypothetical protein
MLSLRDIEASCRALGHEWLDRYPHCCSDCLERGLAKAYRAGQEAMRERCMEVCSDLILRARVCASGDEGLRDLRCLESCLLRAIRALEVE